MFSCFFAISWLLGSRGGPRGGQKGAPSGPPRESLKIKKGGKPLPPVQEGGQCHGRTINKTGPEGGRVGPPFFRQVAFADFRDFHNFHNLMEFHENLWILGISWKSGFLQKTNNIKSLLRNHQLNHRNSICFWCPFNYGNIIFMIFKDFMGFCGFHKFYWLIKKFMIL